MTDNPTQPDGPWQTRDVPCDYCGSEAADVVRTGFDRVHGLPGRFNVVVCRACGLARTNPQPTTESLGTAYPKSYGPHQGRPHAAAPRGFLRWTLVNYRGYPLGRRAPAAVRWLMRPAAGLALGRRRVLGYLPQEGGGRLLDFGCGTGTYVARMAAAGWQAEGIDLGPEAVRAGREAGLVIHQGTLPGADLPPESFDAVTLWASIEHLPSPMATLGAIRTLLRPGGRLLVSCPSFGSLSAAWFGSAWYGLDLPRHLTHFTPGTLRQMLEKAGFEVERTWSVRRPGFIRRTFAQLADERGRTVYRWLSRSRFIVGLLSLVGLLARRADEMVVVARRT